MRKTIPPLQNGDRLTRAEFERRWRAMPRVKKAELINGVVYVAAAIRFDQHGGPHFDAISWLSLYRMNTPGIRGGDNASLRLDEFNEPQPDAFLMIAPEAGGQAAVDKDGYIVRGPEFIVEVSTSSASYDLHDKLETYARHGVREYVIWRVLDEKIDWLALSGNGYKRRKPVKGVYKSKALPGIWLDARALMRGDMPRVAEAAQEGIASEGHVAFAARLQKAIDESKGRKKKPRGK